MVSGGHFPPGTPGRAARVSDCLGGRRVVLGKSTFAGPLTFFVSEDRPKGRGRFCLYSHTPGVPLSLVLNIRSTSPSLRDPVEWGGWGFGPISALEWG